MKIKPVYKVLRISRREAWLLGVIAPRICYAMFNRVTKDVSRDERTGLPVLWVYRGECQEMVDCYNAGVVMKEKHEKED